MSMKPKNPFFPQEVIVRSPGLLPMLYKLPEIAEELGISIQAMGQYARCGLPLHVDPSGEGWIDGRQFHEWMTQTRKPGEKRPLKSNEGFCFKCHRPVRVKAGKVLRRGRQRLFRGTCPKCQTRVYKGVGNG